MDSFFSVQVCLMRFFGGFKIPNQGLYAVGTNTSAPAFSSNMPRYTQQTTLVSFMRLCLVLYVVGSRYISKVFNSIVRRIAVYMVNIVHRPSAIDVHPSKSMRSVAFTFQWNNKIRIPIFSTSYSPNLNSSISAFFPTKYTRIRVVIQHFSNKIRRNIVHSWSIA